MSSIDSDTRHRSTPTVGPSVPPRPSPKCPAQLALTRDSTMRDFAAALRAIAVVVDDCLRPVIVARLTTYREARTSIEPYRHPSRLEVRSMTLFRGADDRLVATRRIVRSRYLGAQIVADESHYPGPSQLGLAPSGGRLSSPINGGSCKP